MAPAKKKPATGASHADMVALDGPSAIDALNLVDYARDAALHLQAQHPDVIFTSGRRNVADQARAMSGNIAKKRRWIEQTYASTVESRSLQKWVDDHPSATTPQAIAAGLEAIMQTWSDAEKSQLSRHFSGQAFDVQPVAGAAGAAIKATIKGLPNRRKFFEKEGGLIIWHADFEAP